MRPESKFSASRINERVYLADINASKNLPHDIKYVISILSKKPHLYPDGSIREHLFIQAEDNEKQDLLSSFGLCYDFIRKALKDRDAKILIHCRAGRSRSATIVMMYLMRAYRWNYDKANQYLHEKRPIIAINKGFKNQLRIFSNLLEKCEWKPNCPCSTCEEMFGKFRPDRPVKTAGKLKRSSSLERHSKPSISTLTRSSSFDKRSRSPIAEKTSRRRARSPPPPPRPATGQVPYFYAYQPTWIPMVVPVTYVRVVV